MLSRITRPIATTLRDSPDDATLTVHVLTVLHFKRGRKALMDRLRAELGSSFEVITDRD